MENPQQFTFKDTQALYTQDYNICVCVLINKENNPYEIHGTCIQVIPNRYV